MNWVWGGVTKALPCWAEGDTGLGKDLERGDKEAALPTVSSDTFIPPGGLSPESKKILTPTLKKRNRAGRGETTKQEEGTERPEPMQPVTLSLSFKRYVFDTQKRMVQTP